MSDCLFCRVVAGSIPASLVYESPTVIAFRDIHPKAPTHVLVIPKEHVASLMDLKPEHSKLLGDIHQAIQAVARQEKVEHNGFRVAVNNGSDSGQTVPHLHYHVLAGRKLNWPPG